VHRISAERPFVEGGKQYHIACKPGDLAKYLLLPGDPQRVPKIASFWDEAEEIAYHSARGYPAVASFEVLLALIEAAETLGVKYHVGITATTSDFYAGQGRRSFQDFWQPPLDDIVSTLQKTRVLNFEMEAAPLFVLSNLFKLRAGAVCAVYANRVSDAFEPGAGEMKCIKVANEAVKILSTWDTEKKRKKKEWIYPNLLNESRRLI